MNYMDRLNNALIVLRTNPYLSATVSLFLVLYASLAAPALPASVAALFEHSVFKMLIMALILVLVKGQNVTVALLVAVGFMVSMSTLSRYRLSSLWASRDTAFGPDGQPQQTPQDTKWSAKNRVNRLNIRGYEYADHDVENHLPGGHGPHEPEGYSVNSYATF
jgi:hypothetical protein